MNPQQRREFLRTLPLAELHRHFDGSIRPATLWELSEKYYSAVPGLDYEQFRHYLQWDDSLDNTLLDYLDKFHVPLQYTQFYDNIMRIAYELAEDAYLDGVRLLELRINPLIHRRAGLTTRQVIHATRKGLSRFGEQHPDFKAGIIVIAMRSHGGNMARILLREVIGEKEEYHQRGRRGRLRHRRSGGAVSAGAVPRRLRPGRHDGPEEDRPRGRERGSRAHLGGPGQPGPRAHRPRHQRRPRSRADAAPGPRRHLPGGLPVLERADRGGRRTARITPCRASWRRGSRSPSAPTTPPSAARPCPANTNWPWSCSASRSGTWSNWRACPARAPSWAPAAISPFRPGSDADPLWSLHHLPNRYSFGSHLRGEHGQYPGVEP